MFAPRNEVPRKSSPAYGASSQPPGSRRWSAPTLASRATSVRAAAIPSEYFRFDSAFTTLFAVTDLMGGAAGYNDEITLRQFHWLRYAIDLQSATSAFHEMKNGTLLLNRDSQRRS